MPVRTVALTVAGGAGAATWEGDQGTVGTAADNALVVRDETVSRYHLRVQAVADGIRVTDFGSTNGTFVGAIRIDTCTVPPGTVLRLGATTISVGAGVPSTVELHDEDQLGALRGRTQIMRRLMSQIGRVAQSSVGVLLIGESGTGKELLARALHDASPRAAGPMVTVDCGAVTPTLVASELFGHEKGAFTGAVAQRTGAFELANGGTLFLDEIGELPLELQPTLLGALERQRFCRVGGRSEIDVDVRVVAATNRDLRTEVNSGRFRLDLYYRLAVVTLDVPPLRERIADLPILVEHFLREEGFTGDVQDVIGASALEELRRHPWPGNVRELKNYVQATLAMGEPATLLGTTSPNDGVGAPDHPSWDGPYADVRARVVEDFERVYLERLLTKTGGNVARAAREGQMARSHLNELLRRHKLR